MDIHKLKLRIDASGKKLVTLGSEYIKSKNEITARKVLVRMFCHCITKCITAVSTAGKICEFLGGSEEAVARSRGFEPLTPRFVV